MFRLQRGWNQTGQKYAGKPDIAKALLPAHAYLLWGLVVTTYASLLWRISNTVMPWASRPLAKGLAVLLVLSAMGFKVAFTKADAPELLIGLESVVPAQLEAMSLVTQARAVLFGSCFLALMTALPNIVKTSYRQISCKGNSKTTFTLLC